MRATPGQRKEWRELLEQLARDAGRAEAALVAGRNDEAGHLLAEMRATIHGAMHRTENIELADVLNALNIKADHDAERVAALEERVLHGDHRQRLLAMRGLETLLPRLSAADLALLGHGARADLARCLRFGASPEDDGLTLALLAAIEAIGSSIEADAVVELCVYDTANTTPTRISSEIVDAARRCHRRLVERAQRERDARTLLRAADPAAQMLVRPAGGPSCDDGQSLVRPSDRPATDSDVHR
jgi:hypothetical protein